MKVLGIALQKNHLRFAVVEGDKGAPILRDKGRQPTSAPDDVPRLLDWYETHFEHLINEHTPDAIAYKLTLEPSLEQLHTLAFPMGVLNLIAKKKNIPICEYSSRGITPSKLGLPRSTNLLEHVDSVFGDNPPYWDKAQKEAVLVAWFCL
ncbi:RuvC family protein [Citrifermentans bremense]|uniref:hypothetical protein n=1 Tax=Citrifermentans bremense TaxID=60035 RepID=UPI00047ECB8A|nr:hypothetical protein [Citrifermentans bremense]